MVSLNDRRALQIYNDAAVLHCPTKNHKCMSLIIPLKVMTLALDLAMTGKVGNRIPRSVDFVGKILHENKPSARVKLQFTFCSNSKHGLFLWTVENEKGAIPEYPVITLSAMEMSLILEEIQQTVSHRD